MPDQTRDPRPQNPANGLRVMISNLQARLPDMIRQAFGDKVFPKLAEATDDHELRRIHKYQNSGSENHNVRGLQKSKKGS